MPRDRGPRTGGRWRETTTDPAAIALAAEYAAPGELVRAAHEMRERGYVRLDAFTPYEVPELEHALGIERTRLPVITLVAALLGATVAYLIQWWTNAVDYPIVVGARPLHSAPAFVPITFETTVLFGGVATFLAVLVLSRLARLWAPIDEIEGFERATVDRFWLAVDGRDPRFDSARTAQELESTGAIRVVRPPSRSHAGLPATRGASMLIAIFLPLIGCDVAGPEPNLSLERMINQPRYDPWEASALFADGKVMREPVPGTVERGRALRTYPVPVGGSDGAWASRIAIEVDAAVLATGRTRYDIYCAPCHGTDGAATTLIAQSMSLRPPPSLVEGDARSLAPGRVFDVAGEGYGLMPAYGHQLSIDERWAVAAWVEVLRLRTGFPIGDLAREHRARADRELARDGAARDERDPSSTGESFEPASGVPEPRGNPPREPGLPRQPRSRSSESGARAREQP